MSRNIEDKDPSKMEETQRVIPQSRMRKRFGQHKTFEASAGVGPVRVHLEPPKDEKELDFRIGTLPEFTRAVYDALEGLLEESDSGPGVESIAVAERLNVQPLAVNGAMTRLHEGGLITKQHAGSKIYYDTYERIEDLRRGKKQPHKWAEQFRLQQDQLTQH